MKRLVLVIAALVYALPSFAQGVPNIQNWTAQPGYANSIQSQINSLKASIPPAVIPGNAGDALFSTGVVTQWTPFTGDISCSTSTPGKCTVTSSGTSTLVSILLANAASTGTTLNKLVKLTGAPSTGVITATSDTNNALGVCVANCGVSGTFPTATVQILGLTSCVFDGATTAGDTVTISSSTAGDCHDSGSSSPVANPFQTLGVVLSTNGGGGTYQIYIDNVGILTASTPPTSMTLTNNNPGTTLHKLVKFTGAPSKGTITATTDINNAIGVCISSCGNSGTANIQYDGTATCVFDGATTAGDFVTISSTTAGDCHDTGSTAQPTNGNQPVGIVLSTNGGGGTYNMYFSTINGALQSTSNSIQTLLVPNRVTTSSGSQSVALSASINQFITLHDSITLTFSTAPPDGYVVRFKLTQNNGGSHTVSWPASVKWSGGTAPTLTTTDGQADWCFMVYDATTTNYSGASCNLNFVP